MEFYEVSLRIQSECGKIRTRKNSVFGHFSRSPYAHKKDSCRLQTLLGQALMNCRDHSHTTGRALISILSLAKPCNRYSQCYVSRLCAIEIYCILFVRQLQNQARLMPLIPYISSSLINIVWSRFNLAFKKFSYQSVVNGLAVLVGQRSENDVSQQF